MAEPGPVRTLGVSFAVALVCALLVSASVVFLRPLQSNHDNAAFNRLLLRAAGMPADPSASSHAVATEVAALQRVRVQLASAEAADVDDTDPAAVFPDERAATVDIPPERDRAGLQQRPPTMPAWQIPGDAGDMRVVLPVYGRGMWSTLRALVTVDAASATVRDLVVVSHGETPGIGDRIEDPAWQAEWRGLSYRDASGRIALTLGGSDQRHAVDAITGATVTSEALVDTVAYWLGEDAYGPYLQALRAGGARP